MSEKILFEIPVYSMSEEKFNKLWKKKKDNLAQKYKGVNVNKIYSLLYPRWLWKYNQIIGYITISVNRTDVIFELFCSLDKKYFTDTKTKHFIQNYHINGMHFWVGNMSTDEIKAETLKYLKIIEKEHLKPKFYVDYSVFNNIFDFVDIKQIMESI